MVTTAGPVCPRCAAPNRPGTLVCARCGRLMRGLMCPQCGREHTRAGAKFCEHCGGDLHGAALRPDAPNPTEGSPTESAAAAGGPAPESPVAVHDSPPAAEHAPADEFLHAGAKPVTPYAEAEPSPREPSASTREHTPVAREQAPAEEEKTAPAALEQASPKDRRAPKGYAARRAIESRPRPSPTLAAAIVVIFGIALAVVWATYQRVQDRALGGATAPRSGQAQPRPGAGASPLGVAPSPVRQAPTPPIGATLKITTAPAGAQVELDGKPVGTTRLTLTGLKPGPHKVKIIKDGFRTVTREFTVVQLETITLDLTLAAVFPQPAARRAPPPPPPPPPPP